jgi:uncharacterized delta-60 repeat protein
LKRTAPYILAAILFLFADAVAAQAGTLDATWASASPLGAGKVMTPIGGSNDSARAIALQSDRKVLVAGACYATAYEAYKLCVLRYNANGTLDIDWNGTGTVLTPMGNSFHDHVSAITQQSDGKVLVAGDCYTGNTEFCAVRYHANGTLDTNWNGTGTVRTSIDGGGDRPDARATAMALQPDGKVLLAGSCRGGKNDNDFCALRYHPDGTLDMSWNGTGKVVTPIGASTDAARAMALQRDGKVLLAGRCFNGTENVFCLLRYLANGALDTVWNGTGSVMTPVGNGGFASASALALQLDGKVIVAGECRTGTIYAFCALRYHIDGTLDTSWNATGKTITPLGNRPFAHTVVVQRDGKVIVAGDCFIAPTIDFCKVRYHADGTVDSQWGLANSPSAGKVITPIGNSHDLAFAMMQQPDGKVLLAGGCLNSSTGRHEFCVARFLGDACAVDLDGDGQVYATTDSLLHARIALRLADVAVTTGINSPAGATRTTWSAIGAYLVGKTLDIDGDGNPYAAIDSLIHARVALGFIGDSVVAGITFPDHATRKTWAQLRPYLVNACGMTLSPVPTF